MSEWKTYKAVVETDSGTLTFTFDSVEETVGA